jgi:hypothetical protein
MEVLETSTCGILDKDSDDRCDIAACMPAGVDALEAKLEDMQPPLKSLEEKQAMLTDDVMDIGVQLKVG